MADTAIKDAASGYTLSYGNVSFGPLCRYRLNGTPEYDPAGRSVVFIRYHLQVTSWEYANTPGELGASMLEKRHILLEPGYRLTINDIGFGDTNTASTHAELAWGPRPLRADFTPLGGGICWQLDWECEFCVKECKTTSGKVLGGRPFLMFNYEAVYSNDDQGFTTRQVTGTATIPQARGLVKDRNVRDWPILHRDSVIVSVPYGYRRIHNQWQENAAQNELSFVIVDRQLDHDPFPPGIHDADIEFSVSSAEAVTNVVYAFSISGTLETLPGWPKSHAALVMYQIVNAKVNSLRNMMDKASILPETIEMSHGIYRRRSSFRFSFLVAGAPRHGIFGTGVLYQSPLTELQFGRDYQNWINGKSSGTSSGPALSALWANGGQTNLQTLPTSGIVDACAPTTWVHLGNNLAPPVPPKYKYDDMVLPADTYSCRYVREENSWLAYEAVTDLIRTNNLRVSKRDVTMPEMPWTGKPPLDSLKGSSTVASNPYKDYGDNVTYNGAPEQLFIFKGKGVRVKYPVSVPKIRSINGVMLDEVDHRQQSIRGPSLAGCDRWYGRFIWVYRPRSYLSGEAIASPHPKIEFA